MRWVWDTSGSYAIHYGRFDARGNVVVADIPLDLDGSFLAGWGVDRAGNVLLIGAKGPGGYGTHPMFPRWLDPMGAALTDWFAIGETYIRGPTLLEMPEGLALHDTGWFSTVFPSAKANAEIAPGWLAKRGGQLLKLVHGGNGYVSFGRAAGPYGPYPYGSCAEGIEVLTSSGTSCGCLAIPNALLRGFIQTVGRDGSLITQRWLSGSTHGAFEVYPGLFR
jgi:hypothetical protein